jgi:hypothetical protein
MSKFISPQSKWGGNKRTTSQIYGRLKLESSKAVAISKMYVCMLVYIRYR